MPLVFSSTPAASVQGFKVIIPAVSVGNVGQLAMDVLLASLKPDKIAAVHHPALLSIVGADPIDESSKDLMTACQMYRHADKKLVLFQVRSSFAKGRRDEFVSDIIAWCSEQGVEEVIVLASSSSDERIDKQLNGTQLRYLSTKGEETFGNLKWTQLEKRDRFPGLQLGKSASDEDSIFIPGGGYSKRFFLKAREQNIPITVLLVFCSEGDNTKDAMQLIEYCNVWQALIETKGNGEVSGIKVPISWKYLYGNPTPSKLY